MKEAVEANMLSYMNPNSIIDVTCGLEPAK